MIGNPHTYNGRIDAWCPEKGTCFCVSLSEIEDMSEYSKYWINGYLNGNQPEPPIDHEGDVDFDSPEYNKWSKETELFIETGYWSSFDRNCEKCGDALLRSELDDVCSKCKIE